MDERATGLILRTRLLSDTSLIVHWITAEAGRIATVAKGARRSKSPLRGKLDLYYEADFSYSRSRRSELHILREVALRSVNEGLRRNLGWLNQAAYACALIERLTESETPIPEVFELFQSLVAHLPTFPPQPRSIFAFELRLLHTQGLLPGLDSGLMPPSVAALAKILLTSTWTEIAQLSVNPPAARALRGFLQKHLTMNLDQIPLLRSGAIDL